ncbi:MocR-like pyridoxine biosynthesis transcription factor PdxR [Caldanaerobius polysaccharolyticus]|uniref:MocR-like pyridoxine biosynthesis transcription factor PdxR n=1 Tax=Caldanaerobius polysaccharolyticus TaxID=44256 RepID=UPI00055557BE|nr:PLP-dependent aminotransferase family protein [Caldanaerobius polysaccharolyticus]
MFKQLNLDKESSQPLYMQLVDQIIRLIEESKIQKGFKLPPVRKLAEFLDVNTATVASAYRFLESNGYVYTRVGSGTYVADQSKKSREIIDKLKLLDQGQLVVTPGMINFASATPAPDLFPVEDFKNIINEVLDRDGGLAFSYQESKGFRPLRESISDFLKLYGIKTSPDDIQVISGGQQGIDILSKAMLRYGDCVFVESPTYNGAIAAFKSRGANIIGIPLRRDGIDLDVLQDRLRSKRPAFIYVMPGFQNPTGYCYSEENKIKLLELAKKYDTYILEDDYLNDLDYSDQGIRPIKSYDDGGYVIYLKSFSKIFMPGLRLAFLSLPQKLSGEVIAAKHITDISTAGLTQRAFDLFLRKGLWKKNLEYIKKIYRSQMMYVCEKLKLIKEIQFEKPRGGLYLWLQLPEGYSSVVFYSICLRNNLLIAPGSLFYPDYNDDTHFRLSFASLSREEINRGIDMLGESIKELTGESENKIMPLI